MRFSELLSATVVASGIYTVVAENAAVITDNPPGAFALCNLPGNEVNGIMAEIVASTSSDGKGVEMTVNINGGNVRQGGPFMYHIHEKAVGSPGDCASTGGHLDPGKVGDDYKCAGQDPATCQVGDISGKHGTCDTIPGCSKSYRDAFLSLTPGNPAYIGDKSFVLHYANKTRIACCSFSMGNKAVNGGPSSTGSSSPSGTSSSSGSGGVQGGPSPSSSSGPAPPPASGPSPSATSPAPSSAASIAHIPAGFGTLFLALLGLTMW